MYWFEFELRQYTSAVLDVAVIVAKKKQVYSRLQESLLETDQELDLLQSWLV